MKIVLDKNLKPEKGDFGEFRDDNTLLLPIAYAPQIRALGTYTVESLYDMAIMNPKHVCELFNWTESQLSDAMSELRLEIKRVRPTYFENSLKSAAEYGLGYKMRDI